MTDTFYQVAGHIFRLSFSDITLYPDNYIPFRIAAYGKDTLPIFHLSVTDDLNESAESVFINRFEDDTADISIFRLNDGGYRFYIAFPGDTDHSVMETNVSFSTAKVKLCKNTRLRHFGFNNALMMLYAFSTAKHETLLIHASVIKNNGEGFLFLGKSGTGKSTHSRLWIEYIQGSELLNDDNPVVRIEKDRIMVYGSPWSGKTPCYHNESIPIKGIVRLQQAPENKIIKLQPVQAYAAILPACSCMKWEVEIIESIHHTVEKLAMNADCYRLHCLPNREAGELCLSTLRKTNENNKLV